MYSNDVNYLDFANLDRFVSRAEVLMSAYWLNLQTGSHTSKGYT